MIVVHESTATCKLCKPVICPRCNRGKLGNIPEWSKAIMSRRGRPPLDEHGECVQVKCRVCNSLWSFTIE